MIFKAKNHVLRIDGTEMSYVEFGYGTQPLILLPGLSDSLKTVRGQAINLAWYYKEFAKTYKVYVFSRKDVLPDRYSTKDMAADLKKALDKLGLRDIYLLGVSQGGMIAQHFAINYHDMVSKLVLVVSVSRPNDIICSTIRKWVDYANCNDYQSMMIDMLEKTYTEKKLKKLMPAYPIICRIGKPKDFRRFYIQANACLTNNTYHELDKIICPTLIVGGGNDKVVGGEAAQEISEKIKSSKLIIYEGLGHAAYEEAHDFNKQIISFLG